MPTTLLLAHPDLKTQRQLCIATKICVFTMYCKKNYVGPNFSKAPTLRQLLMLTTIAISMVLLLCALKMLSLDCAIA